MKTMKEFSQITLWKSHNEKVVHHSLFLIFQNEEIGIAGWSDCLFVWENFKIFPL